ncbi:MAG: hypothetical protein AB7P02_13280 [Alphaproteobacteria bacterium]
MLLDPKVPHRWVPPDQLLRPEGQQVAYLLQVPRHLDRVAYARGLAEAGARRVGYADLARLMARGIEEALAPIDPETADAARRAVAAYLAEVERWGEVVRAADPEAEAGRRAIEEAMERLARAGGIMRPLEDELAELYAPYRRARGDFAVYGRVRGLVAARLMLRGWENVSAAFRRRVDGLPPDLLEVIPDGHLAGIGIEFDRLLTVTEDQARNFASPSRSPSVPETSPAEKSTTASIH